MVSIRNNQVTMAPRIETTIRPYSNAVVPIADNRIGNRNAVATAPILAKAAAKPAPLPWIAVEFAQLGQEHGQYGKQGTAGIGLVDERPGRIRMPARKLAGQQSPVSIEWRSMPTVTRP